MTLAAISVLLNNHLYAKFWTITLIHLSASALGV